MKIQCFVIVATLSVFSFASSSLAQNQLPEVISYLLVANPTGSVASEKAVGLAEFWDKLILKSDLAFAKKKKNFSEEHGEKSFDTIMFDYSGFQTLQTVDCWVLRVRTPGVTLDAAADILPKMQGLFGRKIDIEWRETNGIREGVVKFTGDQKMEAFLGYPPGAKPGDLSYGADLQVTKNWRPGWQGQMRCVVGDGFVALYTVKLERPYPNSEPSFNPVQNRIWWSQGAAKKE